MAAQEFSTTVQCPQCRRIHGATPGAGVTVRCTNCARIWTAEEAGDEPLRCIRHPTRMATWVCGECGRPYCAACVEARQIKERQIQVSACCEGGCMSVAQAYQPQAFHEDVSSLFLYPLRLKSLLVFGFVFVGLMLPVVNLLAWILLAGYLVHILTTSADGGDHLPDFPAFENVWEGFLVPYGLLAFVFVLSNLPLILYVRLAGEHASQPVQWALTGVSVLLFPIFAMSTVITRSLLKAMNLVNLWRIVMAIRETYVRLIVFLAGILVAQRLVTSAMANVSGLGVVELVVNLYNCFVVAHLLGRVIHETRGKVDWDS